MPLPPAPTKRAAMLPPEAFDAPARSSHKAARKSEAPAADKLLENRPQAQDDFDPRAGGGELEAIRFEREAEADPVLTESTAGVEEALDAEAYVEEAPPLRGRKQPPLPAAQPRKKKSTGPAKMFVLDTNVLMHDPMSLFRFEEHDIFLPMIVLEELDGHKKGTTEVARNARQVSRSLDALAGDPGSDIAKGLKLSGTGHRDAGGCLFFQTMPLS
ncbi:MAG: hypothetical protein JWP22_1484, partial [Ramlibacter sp.]|nr:hypothetical protein [Ramlibacter sp.]